MSGTWGRIKVSIQLSAISLWATPTLLEVLSAISYQFMGYAHATRTAYGLRLTADG
ncbi:hypothetical protein [Moorena sp. SIO3A2]|uniref:hypothetical protein n=1 Tax=Moorena sp. SIO3A2 TaxID=2607841 RepID=UPI00257F514D|nr:hypothetical protein [Moorena sp. SIO3A2]